MIETIIYNSYYYSVIVVLVFIWNALSHIDILRLRHKLYIYGIICSRLINNIVRNKYLYDNITQFIIRPTYVFLECLSAFIEGLGNISVDTEPEINAKQELVVSRINYDVNREVKKEIVMDKDVDVKKEIVMDKDEVIDVKKEIVIIKDVEQELDNNNLEPYKTVINALDNPENSDSDSNDDNKSNYVSNYNNINIVSYDESKLAQVQNIISDQENTVTRKKINVKLARSKVNRNT